MKYEKVFIKLKEKYSNKAFNEKDLLKILRKLYDNQNEKTVKNILALLQSNEKIRKIEKDKYIVVTKKIYHYTKTELDKKIERIIKQNFNSIKAVIWNTSVINEFTLHYSVVNYTIVETERIATQEVVAILKQELSKKYTVTTQDIFNKNRKLYEDLENQIIVKPLIQKAPLDNNEISIEKLMIDLYTEKLYLQYQGKELETIYENIFEKYDIELKRMLSYANLRTNIKKYKNFLNSLQIPQKYKIKE